MPFSVIILSKNIDNLRPCIREIRVHEPNARVIVVDDGLEGVYVEDPRLKGPDTIPVKYVPGEKPFVFARNVNIGIRAAGDDDVVLLNDDTRLLTPDGFTLLSEAVRDSSFGIVSPGMTGAVGNLEQIIQPEHRNHGIRQAVHHTIVFVCVYIPRRVLNEIGLMDPRYADYGFCDDDLCASAKKHGYKLGVFDRCLVEHGVLPSAYRHQRAPDLEPNRRRFVEKWGALPEDLRF